MRPCQNIVWPLASSEIEPDLRLKSGTLVVPFGHFSASLESLFSAHSCCTDLELPTGAMRQAAGDFIEGPMAALTGGTSEVFRYVA